MGKYLKTKPGSLESAVLEAVSPAQQAAIAIAKKEKGEKPKNEEKVECPKCKGEGCDHCDGKGYHMKEADELKEREDTAAAVARAMKKMGVKYDRKKEDDIISKIPKVLDTMKLSSGAKKMLLRDRDFIADVLGDLGESVLKEKPADLLVLQFRSSSDAAKAYKVLTQKVAGNMVPYGDAFDEGDELVIEFPDDADKLMKDMKSKGAPSFKVLEREEYSDFAKKKNEELTAKQKKIDMNKDGKITGDDLAKLRAKGAKKEEVSEAKYVGDTGMVEKAAKHIADMWKEASKSPKKEEEEPKKKDEKKTTMTGKPMAGVEINPKSKED